MTRMRIITRTLTAAALLAAISCSSTVRSGNSAVFLVINNLSGSRGGKTPGTPASILVSDVLTGGVVFSDTGSATLQLAQKDITATAPTTNNQVTINRVHVHYRFADGSGAQGVTVPVDFDTFVTTTVPTTGTATISFELVTVQAKLSTPLVQLAGTLQTIAVVADVTFIGKDLVGNDVSAMGSIQIEFGDWADPTS
jgi:hypothetical protein